MATQWICTLNSLTSKTNLFNFRVITTLWQWMSLIVTLHILFRIEIFLCYKSWCCIVVTVVRKLPSKWKMQLFTKLVRPKNAAKTLKTILNCYQKCLYIVVCINEIMETYSSKTDLSNNYWLLDVMNDLRQIGIVWLRTKKNKLSNYCLFLEIYL